jgi:hypothetical protein
MTSTQNQSSEDISWHILVGTIVAIVPATLCVILRFISRHVSRAGLWWDDYTIAIALVSDVLILSLLDLLKYLETTRN